MNKNSLLIITLLCLFGCSDFDKPTALEQDHIQYWHSVIEAEYTSEKKAAKALVDFAETFIAFSHAQTAEKATNKAHDLNKYRREAKQELAQSAHRAQGLVIQLEADMEKWAQGERLNLDRANSLVDLELLKKLEKRQKQVPRINPFN